MRGRRIGTVAAVTVVLALGIGACGDDDSTTGTDTTASSTSTGDASAQTEAGAEAAFVEIVGSKDPATCDRLTDNYVTTLFPDMSVEKARTNCEQVITEGNDPGEIEVQTVTVKGDEASGEATSALGYQRFTLVYVDGEWQLDTLQSGLGEQGSGSGDAGGSGGGN